MADDVFVDVHFPKAGIDRSMGFGKQPNRPLPGGDYARTCAIGQNVRAFEPTTNRGRGGQRPGLSKYITAPVVQDWIIQCLSVMVRVESASAPPPTPAPPHPPPVATSDRLLADGASYRLLADGVTKRAIAG